jgi:hypothetical protein
VIFANCDGLLKLEPDENGKTTPKSDIAAKDSSYRSIPSATLYKNVKDDQEIETNVSYTPVKCKFGATKCEASTALKTMVLESLLELARTATIHAS